MRLVAALLATLFVSAEVSVLAHQIDRTHQVCAEHGELVHGDSHAPPEHHEGEEHEHCSIDSYFEADAPNALRVELAIPVALESAPLVVERQITARDRHRLAPKSSPPHA